MANQAKIDYGSIILDPFCGTGSLLIASTYFGGFSYGGDIDIRVLRGNKYFQHGIKKTDSRYRHKPVLIEEEEIMKNTENHSIYANFKQYGLNRPELIRCDLSNLSWRNYECMGIKFDAILCDPPYGLRAGARKSGVKNPIKVPKEYEDNHHPRTQCYDTKDIMYDLLQFVAKYLNVGGRFVYLLPATIDFDENKDLPTHPCLKLIGNSEQQCQGIFRRRLVTMEKYIEFNINMIPFIPPKPDFADMKNKIFFKQHSHHHNNNKNNKNKNKNQKKRNKKKRNKSKNDNNNRRNVIEIDTEEKKDNNNMNLDGNESNNSGSGSGSACGKRRDSPTLTEIVQPKEIKRQKLCLDDNEDEDIDLNVRNNNNNSLQSKVSDINNDKQIL